MLFCIRYKSNRSSPVLSKSVALMFAGLGGALDVEYIAAGAQVLAGRLPEKGQKAEPAHHVHVVCLLLTLVLLKIVLVVR